MVVAKDKDKSTEWVGPQQRSTLAAVVEGDTDWDKCMLCHEVTGEVLQCPAGSKRSMGGAGYKTLETTC